MTEFITQTGSKQEGQVTLGEILDPIQKQQLQRVLRRTRQDNGIFGALTGQARQRPFTTLAVALGVGAFAIIVVKRRAR